MKKSCISESSKLDRKTIERNRRIHMKGLCFKLVSLIPPHHHKTSKVDLLSQQDQLDQAASYIKQLKEKIDELEKRKKHASMVAKGSNNNSPNTTKSSDPKSMVIRDWGSGIEVSLVSGVDNKNFMLYEVIGILQEEGAEVVSANFSTIGDKIFHTLHAQVKISRVGIETSRVRERLQELIHST